MKTKKIFIASLLMVGSLYSINAQTDSEKRVVKHELGLSAGVTSGKGFSYRYWPGKIGIQITSIPPLLRDGKFDYFNGGFSLLYALKEVREGKFYLYAAGSYEINREFYSDYILEDYYDSYGNYIPGYYNEGYKFRESINAGAGIGFDIFMGKYLGFNLQTGYGLVDFTHGVNTTLAVEAGLYFKFNKK